MWKEITIGILSGLLVGYISGASITLASVKSAFGDAYEINKPKLKGEGNSMLIEQENQDTDVPKKEKKGWLSKIFKRNGKSK